MDRNSPGQSFCQTAMARQFSLTAFQLDKLWSVMDLASFGYNLCRCGFCESFVCTAVFVVAALDFK